MRVVVIGAQSFIGFHLTKILYEAGYEVTVADIFDESSPNVAKFESFFEDKVSVLRLKSYTEISKADIDPEVIINLVFYKWAQMSAATAFDPKLLRVARFGPIHQAFEAFLDLTLAKKSRVFINIESAESIYGKSPIVPIDERSLTSHPDTAGATQIFSEIYLSAKARKLKTAGLWSAKPDDPNYFSFACLRMSDVFGPVLAKGDTLSGFVGSLSKAFLSGNLPQLPGNGHESRDLLYVDDAVSAVLACLKKLESTPIDDVFNVGSGVELRDAELTQALLRNLHELASEPTAPKNLQNTLKFDALDILAEDEDAKLQRFCLECTKFRAFFGWRPRHDIFRSLKTSVEESFGA